MELQSIERRLANVNYTSRRSDNRYHHQVDAPAFSGATQAVRLRHSRLRLLNEVVPTASMASPEGEPSNPAGGASFPGAGASSMAGTECRGSASLANRRRREVLAEFRRRAALTLRQRMPVVRDVNKIDRHTAHFVFQSFSKKL